MEPQGKEIYELRLVTKLKAIGLNATVSRFALTIEGVEDSIVVDLSATDPDKVLGELIRQVYIVANSRGYGEYQQKFKDLLDIK